MSKTMTTKKTEADPTTQDDKDVEELLNAVDETDPQADPEEVAEAEAKKPSEKAERDLKVAAVIPMHQVPGINAKRGRGRPKKIKKQPTPDDLVYHAAMQEAQTEYVDQDPLVEAAHNRKGSAETLYLLKERLTRLAATLEFRRIEDEKYGGESSPQIISRQAAVLKEVAQIELKIKEMDVQLLDPYSEPVQKLMGLFIEKIKVAARDALSQEHFDILFNRLENALENWEEEAENLLR